MAQIYRANVLVCGGTGCVSSGSLELIDALEKEVERRGLSQEVKVVQTGCRGFCAVGPVIVIYPEGTFYCQVKPEDVPELVEETLVKGRVVQRLTYQEPETHQAVPHYADIPFYGQQVRIALRNCGMINPENIEEYISQDGYQGLARALTTMAPDQVIEEVKKAGLRGRGGAGFPAGMKWDFERKAKGDKKYIICNADEGDPGAFMDRSVLEGDPHSVIEGMLIGAYAIGSDEGYIYCRAEYPVAIEHLNIAIAQAEEYGFLGDNILGTNFSFRLHVKEGAGAFVCGEETALMASVEGRRGEPRPRPPFPAVSGLWACPTSINNVETWANVPVVLAKGADWFASIGTEKSKGTKVFALTGKVNNTGLIEVPMGITMRDIIFGIGEGMLNKKKFKAVQTGGPLGGCLPAALLDTPIDYDSLIAAGATMGSGGMIVLDEDTCMVEFARYFLNFASAESCGKCVPCRVGGQRMLEILTRITEGKGTMEDLDTFKQLAEGMRNASLCALGQLTPSPVMSTMRYFMDEYISHIADKRCATGACQALTVARCVSACPAEVDVPSYITLTSEGRYDEALAIHRERNPFASICGRVCYAFCEKHCRRADLDEPVAIRLIKRFMTENALKKEWTPERLSEPKAEKVAIIGAGPAGLTAALRLWQQGYTVTVFDALPEAGGMLLYGIPENRLPRDIAKAEIDNILRTGIEFHGNTMFGRDINLDDLLVRDGYNAVIISIGTRKKRGLDLPGVELLDQIGLEHNEDGGIKVGYPFNTSREKVFAAGDAVLGHTSVVQAVAQGNQVAAIVAHYLQTGDVERLRFESEYHVPASSWKLEDYVDAKRPAPETEVVTNAQGKSVKVEKAWDAATTQEECHRCLRCDIEWKQWLAAREAQAQQDAAPFAGAL